ERMAYWFVCFFFSSRRRHTRSYGDWSSDVCSSDLDELPALKEFYAQHQSDSDFMMIGIVRQPQESTRTIKAYVNDEAMKWTIARSEERRVGKECRCRGWRYD